MISNLPKGDVWCIEDTDTHSQHKGQEFIFDFSYIKSEIIKNVVKVYVWRNYREGNKTLSTLRQYNFSFKIVNNYLSLTNIFSLKSLTNEDVEKFISYLKTYVGERTKKPLSYVYQKRCLDTLKSIIRWGQLHLPDEFPTIEIFTGNEFRGVNSKLKIDFIPDDVVEKINKSLKQEKNLYVKCGIIILQSTGMRIGDLLQLKVNSLSDDLIKGYRLTWYDHKNRKERQPTPVSNTCAIAMRNLIEHTKKVREQVDEETKDYVFIHQVSKGKKVGQIMRINPICMISWFNAFIQTHDICGEDGELYNLTGHQFRRTLATDMLSKGTDLRVIQDVLGHASPATTKASYADVKDKERAEMFKDIGVIGNIHEVDETIIANKKELKWFKENMNKGARMQDGFCTMPCSDGKICDRLLKRQKCYTCKRYITTPEYLQDHRSYLKALEKKLEDNIYGEHYAKHFEPTIDALRVIIKKLEELKDDTK
ncbi:integrase [Bacillus wiedmannii]|uniref:tyrosine-type recombinase/integrase n=1 Tax=Bacillus TaxID=1386 RepID=UPI0007CB4CE0|nr:tyrosine-type recombinase/integrase [Bacillus wiedmannii]OAK16889.1 integrase [Bacillus wiedmannii]OAK34955.1 integrase [Bacillus wiedmannii]OAK38435.1 integrase [Bacillus wiedmannii]PHB68986.1 integrase [Bacillus wiedmannii]HDR7642476.1 tyrosine-type recombinase/integrase [Bacillus wiedmannii]